MLPDGLARLALVEPPPGVDARELVRFRLASSLPWPAAEAIVDTLPPAAAACVGAALRRATVAEYEQAAVAAGARVEQVHLAPLVALAGLLRAGASEAVHALLGDVALCLASCATGRSWRCAAGAATARAARPRVWRRSCDGSRRRDAGNGDRPCRSR